MPLSSFQLDHDDLETTAGRTDLGKDITSLIMRIEHGSHLRTATPRPSLSSSVSHVYSLTSCLTAM